MKRRKLEKKKKKKKERKKIWKRNTWPREFWGKLGWSLQQMSSRVSSSSAWPSRRGWGKFLHILDTESEPQVCLLREKELFWSGFWSSGCLQRSFRWCTSRLFQLGDTPGEFSHCNCGGRKFHKTRPCSAMSQDGSLRSLNSIPFQIFQWVFKSPVQEIDSQIWWWVCKRKERRRREKKYPTAGFSFSFLFFLLCPFSFPLPLSFPFLIPFQQLLSLKIDISPEDLEGEEEEEKKLQLKIRRKKRGKKI